MNVNRQARNLNFNAHDGHFRGDVSINGNLKVKGSTTTVEVNNLKAIEKLNDRMIKLEKRNELLEKIIIKLQFHPDSPYVGEVAEEWNELYKNGEIDIN
jgi:hypothetical protein